MFKTTLGLLHLAILITIGILKLAGWLWVHVVMPLLGLIGWLVMQAVYRLTETATTRTRW